MTEKLRNPLWLADTPTLVLLSLFDATTLELLLWRRFLQWAGRHLLLD